MWNEIISSDDLTCFMETYDDFHDSCIKEMKYISGAYVNSDLSMHPVNDKRILKLIIQRQFNLHSAIEMEFLGLKYLKMFPNNEKFTCEILDATMILKNDCVYWCDCGGLAETDLDDYKGTVICASKARWRVIGKYMGSQEIYVSII